MNHISQTTTDKVRSEFEEIFTTLYNLDIYLASGYRGDKGEHDTALHKLRFDVVRKALDAVSSEKYFGLLDDIENN